MNRRNHRQAALIRPMSGSSTSNASLPARVDGRLNGAARVIHVSVSRRIPDFVIDLRADEHPLRGLARMRCRRTLAKTIAC